MSGGPIAFDLTEFLGSLVRSGIQRVAFKIARHWPNAGQLQPCRVDESGTIWSLPTQVFDEMAVYFGASPGSPDQAARQLRRYAEGGKILPRRDLDRFSAWFNPEVFFQPHRIRFYQDLLKTWKSDNVFFMIYDLLPWLHPEWFDQTALPHTLDYPLLLRRVRHHAFISEQSRQDFARRFLREDRPLGPAVALGADSLGVSAPSYDPARRCFAVLGTIEPRKNHLAVLDAFERLWAVGEEAELLFLGRMGWVGSDLEDRVRKLERTQPRFRWCADASDQELSAQIRRCRATIYPSHAEGFGLPPLESLALGVPVIVSEHLPSVQMIASGGQLRVAQPDSESLVAAVQDLLREDTLRRLIDELRLLELPTWKAMGQELSGWIETSLADRAMVAAA